MLPPIPRKKLPPRLLGHWFPGWLAAPEGPGLLWFTVYLCSALGVPLHCQLWLPACSWNEGYSGHLTGRLLSGLSGGRDADCNLWNSQTWFLLLSVPTPTVTSFYVSCMFHFKLKPLFFRSSLVISSLIL